MRAAYFFAVGLLALLCLAEIGLFIGHAVEEHHVRAAIIATDKQRTLAERIALFAERSVTAPDAAERQLASTALDRDLHQFRLDAQTVPAPSAAAFIHAAKALRASGATAGPGAIASFRSLHDRVGASYDRVAQRTLHDGELTGRIYIVAEVLVSAGLLLALCAKMFWIFLPLETRLGRSRTDLEAQMTRLRASEARQRMVLGEMPALVWTTDRQFLLTSIGGGSLQDLGMDENALLGKAVFDIFAGADSTSLPIQTHSLALDGKSVTNAIMSFAGRVFQTHLEPQPDEKNEVVGVIGVAIDVTEHQRHLDAMRRLQANLERAQSAARVGSWEVDLKTGDVSWSNEMYHLLGLNPAGKPPPRSDLKKYSYPGDLDAVRAAVAQAAVTGKPYTVDRRLIAADGTIRWVQQHGQFEFDAYGRPLRLLGTAVDISARKEAEEWLAHRATHDYLTGALNRSVLYERLTETIESAAKQRKKAAVVFIDLDNFKDVNDQHGHANGDLLLGTLAGRFRETMRRDDSLVRAGGDEFVALIGDAGGREEITAVAERLFAALGEPMVFDGRAHRQTASIGISVYPDDGTDAETLVRMADTAMYNAKESGKNSYRFYTTSMDASGERQEVEHALRRAIAGDELLLCFQPVVDNAGTIVSAEALVRWRHPLLGIISPSDFVPIAEASGLILELDAWVIRRACAHLNAWRAAGVPAIRLSINISARQFQHPHLLRTLRAALDEYDIAAGLLELELTEGVLMDDFDSASRTLEELKAMGIRLAIDDFGTGYSSLSYLKHLPIDTIKIDRSFISEIPGDNGDVAIVNAIVTLARILGRTITAEGVETRGQLDLLTDIGCDYLQGFLFSRPVEAAEFALLLRAVSLQAIAVPLTPRAVPPNAHPTWIRSMQRARG